MQNVLSIINAYLEYIYVWYVPNLVLNKTKQQLLLKIEKRQLQPNVYANKHPMLSYILYKLTF